MSNPNPMCWRPKPGRITPALVAAAMAMASPTAGAALIPEPLLPLPDLQGPSMPTSTALPERLVVPSPSSLTLLALAGVIAARRGRR